MEHSPLKIIHCFRSPVGGIFRHVRDLVNEHDDQGHEIGIFCDSSTGGEHEEKLFEEIRPKLKLGLTRIPMRRAITPADMITLHKTYKHFNQLKPDILHAHGAKGGAYARIIGSLLRVSGTRVARLYCPHGGSIHYNENSMKGRLYFGLERSMERMSDRLIFVSRYEMNGYINKIGKPRCPVSLVYNGLSKNDFTPVKNDQSAVEFLYIGMMRDIKGPDVFLKALSKLHKQNAEVRAHFVGDGPDKGKYLDLIKQLELDKNVTVHDAMPAREAFAKAKVVVVPSRAESMPYIVLEAIAAQKPVICTNVGGIPEIFEHESAQLVEASNVDALANKMSALIKDRNIQTEAIERRELLKERFSIKVMADDMMSAYRSCLDDYSEETLQA